ncbi:hypothetical protein C8R44DRAFT_883598 [Mycena epipterygia]|nr:hypothetical protein C8R44DRAFT_883598 [Mycena epipterygia]
MLSSHPVRTRVSQTVHRLLENHSRRATSYFTAPMRTRLARAAPKSSRRWQWSNPRMDSARAAAHHSLRPPGGLPVENAGPVLNLPNPSTATPYQPRAPTLTSRPPRASAGGQQQQSGGVIQVVHTDDAATKLSDRIRRRRFICCTTDTSTWRRSNLCPGKVLCNKCGLFEHMHLRPRPEHFPHKHGPLASSPLCSRSPPA